MKNLNYKHLGEQFKLQKEKLKKNALVVSTAAFITLSATSCDYQPRTGSTFNTAKGDYNNGKTEQLIAEKKAEQKILIEAYNEYFDIYEKYQADYLDLYARGDTGGCENLANKMEELEKTIRKTEKEIDKTGDKLLDLREYFNRGKKKSKGADAKQEVSKNKEGKVLQRRSFDEYR